MAYDRLTALDASFLAIETESSHMHVGAVAVFGPGPLTEHGGVDIERFRRFVESVLHPRYRQRVAGPSGSIKFGMGLSALGFYAERFPEVEELAALKRLVDRLEVIRRSWPRGRPGPGPRRWRARCD